jgi:septation ring formation regulator EzrA
MVLTGLRAIREDSRAWRSDVPMDLDVLKLERDKLKDALREVEAEVRKIEASLKALRQREIQAKREIEALTTLIEIKETRDAKPAET